MTEKLLSAIRLLNRGFTLIELIVVVTIIGILGAVVISVIDPQASTDRARDTLRIENLRKIVDAVEAYGSLEGGYPTDQTVLQNSNYIANWPDDEPLPGDRYNYTYSTVGGDPFFVVTTEASNGDEFRYSSIDSAGGDPGGRILRCSGGTCESL